MDVPARRQPPTVRLRRLAAELRGLREAAKLSREQVSTQTNINAATLYRIETAKVRPQRRTLLTLLDQYGITDDGRRAALVELSQQAGQLGWLQAFESELPEEYTAYISFEAEARSVRNYEGSFVPGLLQTEDYARAVVGGVLLGVSAADIEYRVEARMRRQSSIAKADPLQLWAIVDEAVLTRQVGGPAVMAGQLAHLAQIGREPHVTLQVLPFHIGVHPGMHGAFAVMDFPDAADAELVYVESRAGSLFLEREADVRRYTDIFEHLRAVALSPNESLEFVERLGA